LDLTPYVGQTIQIVWWYHGVSIGDPVYGWLLDDIAITGTGAGASGTIVISASIGQSSFKLTGPVNRSGSGALTTLTNMPLGDYDIQFNDVPFYQTPVAQSGRLTKTITTWTFTGDYGFIDANRNGMSDAWEKYYFGAVITNRTQLTDTDGDGMSDYAEFMAGTDPTNADSNLRILSAALDPKGKSTVAWSAVPGRSYRLESSSDFITWTPVSDWRQASVSPGVFTLTNAVGNGLFYRVQVRP
jgi:hypothetical protein